MNYQKLLDLAITFIVWAFVSLPIHEYGHWLGGQLTGVPLSIEYRGLEGYAISADGQYNLFTYLGGGLFAAMAFALLWWRARASPTEWDLDDEFVLAIMGAGQIGMALAEGGAYLYGWPIMKAEMIGGLVLALGASVWYVRRIARWLTIDATG